MVKEKDGLPGIGELQGKKHGRLNKTAALLVYILEIMQMADVLRVGDAPTGCGNKMFCLLLLSCATILCRDFPSQRSLGDLACRLGETPACLLSFTKLTHVFVPRGAERLVDLMYICRNTSAPDLQLGRW